MKAQQMNGQPANSFEMNQPNLHTEATPQYAPADTMGAYVHDPESLYNEVGQEQFLLSLLRMQLQSLSFPALCQLVRRLLLLCCYTSVRSSGDGTNRKTWGDGGLEMLAFSHTDLSSMLTAVQVKLHRENVPRRSVYELRGAMQHQRADAGLIVATSSFSSLAREAAGAPGLPPVHLMDNFGLAKLLLEKRLGVHRVEGEQSQGSRWVFDAGFFAALEARAKGDDGGQGGQESGKKSSKNGDQETVFAAP